MIAEESKDKINTIMKRYNNFPSFNLGNKYNIKKDNGILNEFTVTVFIVFKKYIGINALTKEHSKAISLFFVTC